MAADLLGAMRVEIVGDNSKLDKSINESKKNTEKFGKSTAGLGASLGKLFTGIGFAVVAKKLFDLGKQAEKLFQIQETAEAKLDQTLKATGEAAGLTAQELKNMAAELQKVTKVGDEATIGAQSLLLTFKSIGGDVFPRALESILDVSEAMGQDLKSSTIQIGKALNDPIAGLSALSRVGIQFSDVQKDLIKGFQESGDLASAQGVILEELESQFGGVARAAALTAEGVQTQLNNSFGDLLETIGSVIAEGMTPFRENLRLEVESVNISIQALILRRKALAGEATLVEELTLKQIELQKAKKDQLQQDKAEEQQLARLNALREGARETYIGEREQLELREKSIGNVSRVIDTEVMALERGIGALKIKIGEEKALLEANFRLAEGVQTVTDKTDDSTAATNENTEALKVNLTTAQDTAFGRQEVKENEIEAAKEQEQSFSDFLLEQEEKRATDAETAEKRKQAARQTSIDLISSGLNVIDQLADNAAAAEIARLEEQGATEEEIDKKKKQLALENATRERAIGVFDIAVNTASAIVKGFAQLGPIGGAIAAVVIGGLGIAQTAAVLSAPLPKFAKGGTVAGTSFTGDRVPIMVNSAEDVLTRNQSSELMTFIKSGMGGTTNNSSNININAMFSLGNESKINDAAKRLFPALQREGERRGASIGGL